MNTTSFRVTAHCIRATPLSLVYGVTKPSHKCKQKLAGESPLWYGINYVSHAQHNLYNTANVYAGCCLATKSLNLNGTKWNGGVNGRDSELLGVTFKHLSYIPQTKQHLPFGLKLFYLENTTIMCIHSDMRTCITRAHKNGRLE